MSMITATAWVPRGYAAHFPSQYQADDDEIARISNLAKLRLEDARDELRDAQADKEQANDDEDSEHGNGENVHEENKIDVDDDLREYDLEHYDEEAEEGVTKKTLEIIGNVKSLAYYDNNEEDPYITLPAENAAASDDDEREELQVLETDNLLLAAKVEDEVAHLEVYVYEDAEDNLYVHHDMMLPSIPLCVEWLETAGSGTTTIKDSTPADGRKNYVAIGTFDPDIEIWDLDTVDCMYPHAILGPSTAEADETDSKSKNKKKKKKKDKKSKKPNSKYHVDAILALACNRNHPTLLASGSADATVKLWDLNTAKCARSSDKQHSDKVSCLDWHPQETAVLLSGGYDRSCTAADMRTSDDSTAREGAESKLPRWRTDSDVESVKWNPHAPNYFFAATESGKVYCFDIRSAPSASLSPEPKPVWMLQAHDDAVSAFDVNPSIPGFLATGSSDRTVKLWSTSSSVSGASSDSSNKPSLIATRNLGVGRVFSASFPPSQDRDVAFRLAVAGSKGALQIWDTSTNAAARRAFATRVASSTYASAKKGEEVKDRTVGIAPDDSDSSDDDEEEDGNGEDGNNENGWESMDED